MEPENLVTLASFRRRQYVVLQKGRRRHAALLRESLGEISEIGACEVDVEVRSR